MLSKAEADRWLNALNKVSSADDEKGGCLEQLRDGLEADCWLARWKREDVIFDLVQPTMVAVCLEMLLKLVQSNQSIETNETLEEIVQTITRGGIVR